MSLIGLDIGITGCKAALFSEDGQLLEFAYREYPLISPQSGWAELDSSLVLQRALECLRSLDAENASDRPVALAVSSQGEAVTPQDARGEILSNAIVAYDARTTEQVEFLRRGIGGEPVMEITGQPLHTMYTATNLMWVREHQPELFAGAKKWLTFMDLAAQALGADPAMDYSMASRTLLFDIRKKEWSDAMMEACGLSPSLFTPVMQAGTPIGEVSADAAARLRLPRGLKIVTGGHDQPCSALGAGVVDPGRAADGMGSFECVTAVSDEPVITPTTSRSNIPCNCHVMPDRYVCFAFVATGGSLTRWFRDTFGPGSLGIGEDDDFYPAAIKKALDESRTPSGLLLLPHFAGSGTPWSDPLSRGAVVGLTLETRAADLYRAILEGTALEIRMNIELLEEAGIEVREVFATGGGSRSESLLKLKADITGRPTASCEIPEASALGAALLAGIGTGVYESYGAAVEEAVRYAKVHEPDPEVTVLYDEIYDAYRRLYPAVRSVLEGTSGDTI